MLDHETTPPPTPAKAELEPRFSLPSSTPKSSKTELVIGGVRVYIYGLDQLRQRLDVEIGVLYLAHNRTRTYQVTENIAHEVLHRYRNDHREKKVEFIAVTMNMRNHGDREISPQANTTWKDGNDNHAMDLLSTIAGCVHDFKLVIDYLPTYFSSFTRFHNIMAGVSLGGHTAWRLAIEAPKALDGMAVIVGSPNLTSLLLNRLGIDVDALDIVAEELENVEYDRLEKVMNEEQRQRWPRALAELIQKTDREISKNLPTNIPLLLCNGMQDQLVPARYTASWVNRRVKMGENGMVNSTNFFVQDNTGHSCTKEMVTLLSTWLVNLYEMRRVGD